APAYNSEPYLTQKEQKVNTKPRAIPWFLGFSRAIRELFVACAKRTKPPAVPPWLTSTPPANPSPPASAFARPGAAPSNSGACATSNDRGAGPGCAYGNAPGIAPDRYRMIAVMKGSTIASPISTRQPIPNLVAPLVPDFLSWCPQCGHAAASDETWP